MYPEGEIEFELKNHCSSGLLQVTSEFYSKGKISKKLELNFVQDIEIGFTIVIINLLVIS